MNQDQNVIVKRNVSKFEQDVRNTGSYAYTDDRLSARIANARFSECIKQSFNFSGKTVLDLGCGDGTYTMEFVHLNVKEVIGIDPAKAAIDSANEKAGKLGIASTIKFEEGNIYELDRYLSENRFDCIVLRGVLHHLPDPARAIQGLSAFKGTVIVLEPNGYNPVLKLLEKYSRYHIEHEERSFTSSLIKSWLKGAEFQIQASKLFNLVPFFCPDWMARMLQVLTPFVERIPVVREIACGQSIIVASK
ncbi:MAG: class I SAM-dependent methyltransferase [Burkholderiales bacterium]|nr:class I SAM-dependent methyltransferase [Burkholderiales bacterium]